MENSRDFQWPYELYQVITLYNTLMMMIDDALVSAWKRFANVMQEEKCLFFFVAHLERIKCKCCTHLKLKRKWVHTFLNYRKKCLKSPFIEKMYLHKFAKIMCMSSLIPSTGKWLYFVASFFTRGYYFFFFQKDLTFFHLFVFLGMFFVTFPG